jgi:hypothetical protein
MINNKNNEKILHSKNIIFNIEKDIDNEKIKFSLLQNENEIYSCNIERLYLDKYNLCNIKKHSFFTYNKQVLDACKEYLIYKVLEYIFYNNKNFIILTSFELNYGYENNINFLKLFGFTFMSEYNLVEVYDCGYLDHYERLEIFLMELNSETFFRIKTANIY